MRIESSRADSVDTGGGVMSDGSGFDWFKKVDTNTGLANGQAPPPKKEKPPPKKKNIWGEEVEQPDFDTAGMSAQEIEERMYPEIVEDKTPPPPLEKGASLPWQTKDEPKEEPIVTDNWPQNDPSEEPLPVMKQAPQAPVPNKKVAEPVARSNNPYWELVDHERSGGDAFLSGLDNFVLCGIAGPPGCGKTGMVLDSLTDEEIANGAEIWHIDFDRGGKTSKHAHHRGKTNILTFDPWVFKRESGNRVPTDYEASYLKTMDLLSLAIEQMHNQTEYYRQHGKMPERYLKTLLFDGSDKWESICRTLMKVQDLGLGADGIGAAKKRVTHFSWHVRKTRYTSASECWQGLMTGGVHVYTIAHMKSTYDGEGNIIEGQEIPGWLKDSDGDLQQVVLMELIEERDELGRRTGVIDSYAVLTKNRTSLDLPGRHQIFHRAPPELGGSTWYGWPSLKYGKFETDQGQGLNGTQTEISS